MSLPTATLLPWSRTLVVIAHPDDESFGLGAVIDLLVREGGEVHVLCLTAGEASTLGADAADLAALRAAELEEAARALGVTSTRLRRHPDGALGEHLGAAVVDVEAAVADLRPDVLLVFDAKSGVTGHPDHSAASEAAFTVARRHRLPVLEWFLPEPVVAALNDELGVSFPSRAELDEPIALTVDRTRQREAIAAHVSQAVPGSILWRRLELLGDREHLRLTPAQAPARAPDYVTPSARRLT